MLRDINTGIAWVLHNAAAFGGDGESFHLVGQSAGGQLGSLALVLQVGRYSRHGPPLAALGNWEADGDKTVV